MGKVATSPLPSQGSPPLQSGGQNQKWPTYGQSGYVTPAVSGIPTAAERGAKSEVAHLWAKWLRHPCRLGDPHRCGAGGESQVAHLWAKWLRHPCRLGDPHRYRAGGKIRNGPLMGKRATPPLPSRGSPPLRRRGAKSEVSHLWAKWLRHPCRLGDTHRCRAGEGNQKWPTYGQHGYVSPAVSGIPTASEAGGKIRSGPLMGKVATSPLPSRGSPQLQSGGQNQKWPTYGQSGYITPAISGIPTASERGGGGDQKWPTYGQSGYVTPAVSGIPTASERGANSEVAYLWAKWLRHPCRLGDPHRFRAGGGIRSGPLVGKVATSPLPCRGSPLLQSGGQNQKWPTCGQGGYVTPAVSGIPTASERGGNHNWLTYGQSGYVTPAVSGIPTASERGAKSEVAHLWARWLCHLCRLGDPHRCTAGGKSQVAHLWATWLCNPCRLGDPHRCTAGGKIRSGPLVGKVAMSPLPSRGSPPLQSGGQNQKWPTCGQRGYVTLAVSGIPTASERGGKIRSGPLVGKVATSPLPSRGSPPLQSGGGGGSEVAHLWAKWLRHPCRLGDPHRCRAGGKIRSGPLVGKVVTSPLPSRGSPPLQSGGAKSEVAHLWAKWLRRPCRLGDPHRFRAGGKIRSGPLMGKVAMSPLPSQGSPPLQSGGQNQKWPTYGQNGYVTPAVSGIPTDAERGGKSKVAHLWAKWLRHPCRLGDSHRFRAGGKIRSGQLMGKVAMSPLPSRGSPPLQSVGGKIRSGPLVGKVVTSPVPSRGSPPLQSGGQNQKWPTCGQRGYVNPAVSGIPTASERGGNHKWPTYGQSGYVNLAVSGIPTASERGAKSEVAHLWAKWLRHPCRLGDPHRFRAGGEIRRGPLVGKVAMSPLPSRGSPPLQSGGGNQKWPTCGQSGYVTLAVSGIPTASERGAKSEVAHLWARWLRHPCRLGDPHRFRAGGKSQLAHLWAKWLCHPCRLGDPDCFRAGGKIRSGPLMGEVAMSPLPSRGSPPLHSGGQNQKWPTCGQSGYVTPAVSGIPTAAERGAKSEVAHLWAMWLCHPCRLGDPHRCTARGKIRSGPLVGKVAMSPLPSRGSPPLQSGGQNQKWPTCGQRGYVTLAVSGIPTASERGGKIRSGPLVGKVATSPLPSRGSPPLQSGGGGGDQKWPTYGQSGYVTPAVSGIPTASERGAKSEVAHLWAKWLRHPCRLGDPHRCRAGGKIRSGPLVGKVVTSPLPSRGSPPLQSGGGITSGPLVGKVATSPLPSRGSPPLQSGGQNQKWPTYGQKGYATLAVSGIPTASEAGGKIRSVPLVGKVATSPLPSRGSQPLHSGGGGGGAKSEVAHLWAMGKVAIPTVTPAVSGIPTASPLQGIPTASERGGNHNWLTYGQSGYVTPAVSGIPTGLERGAKSEVAHLWVAAQQGGNHKWPTCGQRGYVTPAVSGIPTAAQRGAKSEGPSPPLGDPHRCREWGGTSPLPSPGSPSEVAHLWARWLCHPCRLGDPHRFRAGGGQNQKWPTYGQSGYVTPAVSGIPTASERGTKSECPTYGQSGYVTPAVSGIPTDAERGGAIKSGQLVGKLATSPLPSRGSPPL